MLWYSLRHILLNNTLFKAFDLCWEKFKDLCKQKSKWLKQHGNKWLRSLGMCWKPNIQVNSKQRFYELWAPRILEAPDISVFFSPPLLIAISLLVLHFYFPFLHLSVIGSMFMATNKNYKTHIVSQLFTLYFSLHFQ